MTMRSCACAGLFLLLVPASAMAEPIPLDDFLQGFANGCEEGDAWTKYRKNLVGDDLTLTGRKVAPDGVIAAIGDAAMVSSDEEDGSIVVSVPVLDATFRGIPLKGFRIGYAGDYPLIDDSVIFAASGDEVLAAFADDLAAFQRDNPDSIVEYTLHDDPEGPRLECFVTN